MTMGVPLDDLMPRSYQKLPPGKYIGQLQSVEKRSNDSGWEAVSGTIGNITSVDGSTTVAVRGSGKEVSLSGQTRNFTFTSSHANEKAKEIGKEQLTGLAWALGIAEIHENSAGKQMATFSFDSTEDALELLSGSIGDEVAFSITHKPRTRKNETGARAWVLDDDGNPIMDDEISRFYPVSVVRK